MTASGGKAGDGNRHFSRKRAGQGLPMHDAGEVGADVDQLAQDKTVMRRVTGLLVGAVLSSVRATAYPGGSRT
jgi:hypothetical protein